MQVIKEYSGVKVTVNEEDLNKTGVIYLLEFPNGKVYVGQTTQKLKYRIRQHCVGKSYCVRLKNALNKYRVVNAQVLEQNLTMSQMNYFEPFYIKLFSSIGAGGYNIGSGGKNSIPSLETKQKISEAQKRYMTDERKKEMSEKAINRYKNISERDKISKSKMKKVKSLPDNITFNSVQEASDYYKISRADISTRYSNGNIHKKTGQTFIYL